jgi:hypothetical protein
MSTRRSFVREFTFSQGTFTNSMSARGLGGKFDKVGRSAIVPRFAGFDFCRDGAVKNVAWAAHINWFECVQPERRDENVETAAVAQSMKPD